MKVKTKGRATYEIERHGFSGTGHWGATGYADVTRTNGVTLSGVSAEDLLGRLLPPGTRVRVTVEVLQEGEWPEKGIDPQHYDRPETVGCKEAINPWCRFCREEHPERYVRLACGHYAAVRQWNWLDRPDAMGCRNDGCNRDVLQPLVEVGGQPWVVTPR